MYRPNSFGPNPFGPTPSARRTASHPAPWTERHGTMRNREGCPTIRAALRSIFVSDRADWLGDFSFLPYLTSISLYSSSFSSRSSHRFGPPIVPVLPSLRPSSSFRFSLRFGPPIAPEPLSGGMSVVVDLHYIRYNWASVTSSSSSIVYFTMKRPGSSGAGVTEVPMRSR